MNEFDLDQFLPYQLAVSAEGLSERFAAQYQESHGLSRTQWRALCHLARANAPLSNRDLERLAHVEKSKLSRALARMEARGLVGKSQNQSDQRLRLLELTPKGQALFYTLAPMAAGFQRKLSSGLGATNAKELAALLDRLNQLVARME